MKKLSPLQQELLTAMRGGAMCHYMQYMGRFNTTPYYFRSDTMRHCTKQAVALLARGLVEKVKDNGYGQFELRACAPAEPTNTGTACDISGTAK